MIGRYYFYVMYFEPKFTLHKVNKPATATTTPEWVGFIAGKSKDWIIFGFVGGYNRNIENKITSTIEPVGPKHLKDKYIRRDYNQWKAKDRSVH